MTTAAAVEEESQSQFMPAVVVVVEPPIVFHEVSRHTPFRPAGSSDRDSDDDGGMTSDPDVNPLHPVSRSGTCRQRTPGETRDAIQWERDGARHRRQQEVGS
jgi:hypothetical protein